MANTIYEIELSLSGIHRVRVQSDDPETVKAAGAWAKATFYPLMEELSKEHMSALGLAADEEPPVCAVHQVPMTRQPGKYGEFWSCHERDEHGKYCSY